MARMKSNAFLTANRGATALEYGLIAAGVGVAIAAAVFLLGGELATLFNRTSTMLPTAPDGGTGEMRVVARNNFADGREGWTGGVLRTLEQIGTGLSLARNEKRRAGNRQPQLRYPRRSQSRGDRLRHGFRG